MSGEKPTGITKEPARIENDKLREYAHTLEDALIDALLLASELEFHKERQEQEASNAVHSRWPHCKCNTCKNRARELMRRTFVAQSGTPLGNPICQCDACAFLRQKHKRRPRTEHFVTGLTIVDGIPQ